MELAQLRYFVTIAETASFTGAAQLLHVSQPALSYQMKHLEEELGTRLFDRRGRRIALTPEGELFLPLAQAVLFRADEAVRVLKEHLGVEVGEIRIGCNPTVATYLVPSLVAAFHKDYPRVRVEVIEGGDLELQQMVHTGSLDFAVVTAPGAPHTLDVTPLGSEYLHLVTPPGHRFADCASIDLGKLAWEDFVLPSNSYNLTAQIIDACRRAGFEPRVAYQAGSIAAVMNFVREGLGVTILPAVALQGLARQGVAVINLDSVLTRDLHLIRGKDRSTTRAAAALMAQVRVSVSQKMHQPSSGNLAMATTPEEREP
jgi:LysR family transcriptional activator of glutamate synthase operon